METTTYPNYAEMLDALRVLASKAASVEGADDIGAFHPLARPGRYREFGQFSSLCEFLDDVADTLEDFLADNGDELEGWWA